MSIEARERLDVEHQSIDAIKIRRIIDLYRTMPGAPMPQMEDGNYLWGEVGGNDHWCFCEQIVETMQRVARDYVAAGDNSKPST